MKRKAVLAALIVMVLSAGWCFHRRLFQDDEKRIREVIEEMRVAAEAKNSAALLEHFSNDYSDANGYTKFALAQMVTRSIGRVDELRADVKSVDVLVTGDLAWATVTVSTEAIQNGQVFFPFGSDQEPETPRLTFKRTAKGDWKIIKVEGVRGGEF